MHHCRIRLRFRLCVCGTSAHSRRQYDCQKPQDHAPRTSMPLQNGNSARHIQDKPVRQSFSLFLHFHILLLISIRLYIRQSSYPYVWIFSCPSFKSATYCMMKCIRRLHSPAIPTWPDLQHQCHPVQNYNIFQPGIFRNMLFYFFIIKLFLFLYVLCYFCEFIKSRPDGKSQTTRQDIQDLHPSREDNGSH